MGRRRLSFVAGSGSLLGRLRSRLPVPAGEHRMDPMLRRGSWVVVFAFLLLCGRLVQLQIIYGERYYQKSTNNFVKDLERPAVRGQIRDRKGQVLAENRPSYGVYITPYYLTEGALDKLRRILDLSEEQLDALRTKIKSKRGLDRFGAFLAFDDISRDQMALIESDRQFLQGIDVEVRAHRSYPTRLAAHLVGHLSQISAEELTRKAGEGYHPGDYIGRLGLERLLESSLRGRAGFEKIIVDARGRPQPHISPADFIPGEIAREPVPGANVILTLDMDLQRILEHSLSRHHSASAAVVEVETGRILAIGSHPAPDSNQLGGRMTRAEYERLSTDPLRPLLDKSLREHYYPGSTFKVIPMLVALEDRLVNPEEKVVCHGSYQVGRHAFRCMKSHGPVAMHDALVQSCNVYFYHLAEKIGRLDALSQMAEQFGFGKPTGIGLGEAPGFLPTQEFYRKHGGFRGGYTLNTAIGQGDVKVTVLQLALAYAALSNGGRLFRPIIVDRVESPAGEVLQRGTPELRGHIAASPESMERVRRALQGVVEDLKGTANKAYKAYGAAGIDLAGKSGTAQVRKNRRGESAGWDTNNDHAWFAAFAPARRAQIAVAVLVEHGGHGGEVAAPVAIEIINGYFHKVAPDQRPRVALKEGQGEEGAPRVQTTLPTASGVR
jgi:penicillin-binding protein 2